MRPGELLSVAALLAAGAAVFGASAALLWGAPQAQWLPAWSRVLIHAGAGAGLWCLGCGIFIEPHQLAVTHLELRHPAIRTPLRAVHLTDLHVSRWGRLEDKLLSCVRGLHPDIILLTGDYTASPGTMRDAELLLSRLRAIAPVYASLGNCEERRPIPRGGPGKDVIWLANESAHVRLGSTRLRVVGINAGDERAFWASARSRDQAEYVIGLYHYPDFIPDLAAVPYDLMLCGHTHGGQVRLPGLGALISLSRAGTRYARGLFQSGVKAAYVSQGVGCEGYGLPRLRFLCPPEVVAADLRPA